MSKKKFIGEKNYFRKFLKNAPKFQPGKTQKICMSLFKNNI